jgi:hypothetical protein
VEPEEVGVTWRSTRSARRDSRFLVSDDIWNVIDCVENGVKQEDVMSGRYKIRIRIRSTSDRVSTQTRQSWAGRGKGIKGLCVTGTVHNDLRCRQEVGEAQQRGRCRRSDSPSHISHCPVCPDGLVAFPVGLAVIHHDFLISPIRCDMFFRREWTHSRPS